MPWNGSCFIIRHAPVTVSSRTGSAHMALPKPGGARNRRPLATPVH